jgi:hypothetical protein
VREEKKIVKIVCDKCGCETKGEIGEMESLFSPVVGTALSSYLSAVMEPIKTSKPELPKHLPDSLDSLLFKLFGPESMREYTKALKGWKSFNGIDLCPKCAKEFLKLLKDFFAPRLIADELNDGQ